MATLGPYQARAVAELELRRRSKVVSERLPNPTNPEELKAAIESVIGLSVPDTAVCPNHTTPFKAISDAYFSKHSIVVWKASRGFGGKSLALAILAYLEAVLLGAAVNILGGSAQQSKNVHAYMTGEHENVPDTFWTAPTAPTYLLKSDPSLYTTRLTNKGRIQVLTASTKSVRGPHPQRLRIDEVDETSVLILDAALGQPQESRGIREQTVLSSTHQYAAGTMTEILDRAADRNWPVYEWCYRESMAGSSSWLTAEQVERKRATVTAVMWDTEYELQEPDPGMLAIMPEKVALMFRPELGQFDGELGEYIEIEAPVHGEGVYATGADWARKKDYSVFVTLRIDCRPMRVVAFKRIARVDWPKMVGDFEEQYERFRTVETVEHAITKEPIQKTRYFGAHDATGLGDVIDGYLSVRVEGVVLVGRARSDILSEYISAIEREEIVAPAIEWMKKEHERATVESIYASSAHLPDSIAAGAMAYHAARRKLRAKGRSIQYA